MHKYSDLQRLQQNDLKKKYNEEEYMKRMRKKRRKKELRNDRI